jgi:hypothetical protein
MSYPTKYPKKEFFTFPSDAGVDDEMLRKMSGR